MLADTALAPDFSLQALARRTDGLSGSDLRETCRNAAMQPVRELMRSQGAAGLEKARAQGFPVRPVTLADFVVHDSHAYAHVDASRKPKDEPVD